MFDFHSPRGSVMHAGFIVVKKSYEKEKLWKKKAVTEVRD